MMFFQFTIYRFRSGFINTFSDSKLEINDLTKITAFPAYFNMICLFVCSHIDVNIMKSNATVTKVEY